MHKNITHYLLLLFFIFGTTQTYATNCHFYDAGQADTEQTSITDAPCHSSEMESVQNLDNDNEQAKCKFCKACSTTTASIAEFSEFSSVANYENQFYIASAYTPVHTDTPNPPPNR